MTEEKKPEKRDLNMFSPIEDDADFEDDTSACGLSPEMLKGAMELYKQTFMAKSPIEELTAKTFYNDVDLKKLGEGTTEAAPSE